MFQHFRKMNEPGASLLLLLLIGTDIIFFLLHVVIDIFTPYSAVCDMCAYMNVYNLIKLFWVIILFAYVARLPGSSGYISWLLAFTYFSLDQALLLHRNAGNYVSDVFALNPIYHLHLGARFFQLAILAVSSGLVLAIVARVYSCSSYVFKKISMDLFVLVLARAFFGMIVDLTSVIGFGPVALSVVGFVEDAGELVVDSLILWSVFRLALCRGKLDGFLLDSLGSPVSAPADDQPPGISHPKSREPS